MKGSTILALTNARGVFKEGIIYGTPKPGTMMQIKATALVNGVATFEVYAPGTDGEQRPVLILLENKIEGKIYSDAYVSGTRGFLYIPAPGEELNVLVADVSGTADDHAVGGMLIADTGTGKFINTTGSPESEPFQLLEAATDPVAEAWMHVMATGQ